VLGVMAGKGFEVVPVVSADWSNGLGGFVVGSS
jgi:hypothetical protein